MERENKITNKKLLAHTPGPWILGKEDKQTKHSCGHDNCKEHPLRITGCDLRAGKNNLWIADILGEHVRVPVEEFRANARLIVAAPELLDTLRNIIEIGKRDLSNPKYDSYFEDAKQAIAKAEEEEKSG